MPVKKKRNKKKKAKQSSLFKRLLTSAIIIIIAFAVIFALYNRKSLKRKPIKTNIEQNSKLIKPGKHLPPELFEFTWVNTANGALLSFKKSGNCTLEFPSVDGSMLIQSKFIVDDGLLHIIGNIDDEYCDDIEGIYSVIIEGNKLTLHAENDICQVRKGHFEQGWFKL